MDGVTQANYAQSRTANVNVQSQRVQQQQTNRPKVSDGAAAPQKGVAAIGAQKLSFGGNVGSQIRPEDAGAKVTRSVDGDTISISAAGQDYVREAAARSTPDTARATARVESAAERPEQTIYDRPQGGGIERPEFERPQVQQIQDDAVEEQEAERAEPRPEAERPERAEREQPAEEEPEREVDTSNLRQYTRQELRQLLYQGEITQKEYDDEIKSREEEEDKEIDKKVI